MQARHSSRTTPAQVDTVGQVAIWFREEAEPVRMSWEQATQEWGPEELTDMLRGDSPFGVADPLD